MKLFAKKQAVVEQEKPKKSQLRDWTEALIVAAFVTGTYGRSLSGPTEEAMHL